MVDDGRVTNWTNDEKRSIASTIFLFLIFVNLSYLLNVRYFAVLFSNAEDRTITVMVQCFDTSTVW